MSAATLKPIRLEFYLPLLSGANKMSLFRADSLVRYLRQLRIGFECRCNGAISMGTHVGLNVATRVCDVYPDKCWFAALCRFWLQCSRTLRRCLFRDNSDLFKSSHLHRPRYRYPFHRNAFRVSLTANGRIISCVCVWWSHAFPVLRLSPHFCQGRPKRHE